jgi:hypothetical protein
MKKWLKRALTVAGIVLAPVGAFYLLAVAPLVGMFALPAYLIWELIRNPGSKERERREREKDAAYVEELIRMHLVAHRLPSTPSNRARVLAGLSRSPARRRPRR